MTMELGGRVTIECKKSNFQAELEFKLKVARAPPPAPHPRHSCSEGAEAGPGCGGRAGGPLPASWCPRAGFLSKRTWGSSSRISEVHPRGGAAHRPSWGAAPLPRTLSSG